jgi:hypothetical protein
MTVSGRLIRVLGAVTAFLLVAGAVAWLGHPSGVAARPRLLARAPTTTEPTATTTTTTSTTTAPSTTTTTAVPTTTTAAPTTTTTRPAPAPTAWRVGVRTMTFVDTTRPTGAAGSDPGEPSRTLPTLILYPSDGPPTAPAASDLPPAIHGGPFPLIVFAHGYDSSPEVYATLLDSWAGSGYVVAAPAFPRSLAGGPLDENDVNNQPGDVSFVIGRILAGALPKGLVNPARIGVAGHSDGGVTAVGVGYDTCCHDPRVSADVVMAGDEHDFPGGHYFAGGSPPLLVLQGDHDESNDASLGQQLFHDAPSPKYLVMLLNGSHLEPFTTDLAHLAVVQQATIGFFDRYLKGRSDGIARLDRAARQPLATVAAG